MNRREQWEEFLLWLDEVSVSVFALSAIVVIEYLASKY